MAACQPAEASQWKRPAKGALGDSSALMLVNKVEKLVRRQRRRPVESLAKFTPEFDQMIQGRQIFYSLRNQFQLQAVCHLDYGPNDALDARVARQAMDERLIDLQSLHFEALEIPQIGV